MNFQKVSEKGIETKKSFGNFTKPFMVSTGMIASNDINLTDGKNVITDEYEITKAFNKHYINIVKKCCRNKLNKTGATPGSLNGSAVIDRIMKLNQNHPSMLKIAAQI